MNRLALTLYSYRVNSTPGLMVLDDNEVPNVLGGMKELSEDCTFAKQRKKAETNTTEKTFMLVRIQIQPSFTIVNQR